MSDSKLQQSLNDILKNGGKGFLDACDKAAAVIYQGAEEDKVQPKPSILL